MERVFALVDCNNFYVSCERVFQPRLEGKPVLVLSNNDGCVIARSNEVKTLGVKMGMPFFELRDFIRKQEIRVFSSNYALHGDMSRRVHDTLAILAPASEEYSIDESFPELTGIADVEAHGRQIKEIVKQWTGIPVSVGIGRTKVLAKIANHIAKKRADYGGVFDLSKAAKAATQEILASVEVSDVWGVGPRYARMLVKNGITSALELSEAPDAWIRSKMTVVGLRIAHELRGISCLPLEQIEPVRQGIACTRSFGRAVTTLAELREAVASYTARVGEKLRARSLAASYLHIFIRTNQFNADEKYSAGCGMALSPATSYTPALDQAAQSLLARCYRPGFRYWKAGTMVEGLLPQSNVQADLFSQADEKRKARLMDTLDGVNRRFGRGTLRLAGTGIAQPWHMKRAKLSPRFTTCWDELARVKAG